MIKSSDYFLKTITNAEKNGTQPELETSAGHLLRTVGIVGALW